MWGNDDEDDFLNAYATPEEVVFEKEVLLCKDVDKKAEDRMIKMMKPSLMLLVIIDQEPPSFVNPVKIEGIVIHFMEIRFKNFIILK